MFIVCGVLYGIDSVTERNTKIRLAIDLYSGTQEDINLSFSNPFRNTTTVGYNYRTKVCVFFQLILIHYSRSANVHFVSPVGIVYVG